MICENAIGLLQPGGSKIYLCIYLLILMGLVLSDNMLLTEHHGGAGWLLPVTYPLR